MSIIITPILFYYNHVFHCKNRLTWLKLLLPKTFDTSLWELQRSETTNNISFSLRAIVQDIEHNTEVVCQYGQSQYIRANKTKTSLQFGEVRAFGFIIWSGDGDLNPGPLVPETSVLPTELSPGWKNSITG